MSDLPRYPGKFRGYPPMSEEALLAWLSPLSDEILDLTPPDFRELMMERIRWAVSWFHLLPASSSCHHFEAGGLLRHSLECAKIFLSDMGGVLQCPMLFAGAIAALTHDAGKPLTDTVVTDSSGKSRRIAFTETPLCFSARIGYRPYFLRWRRNRHGSHDRILPAIAGTRFPTSIRDALAEKGADMPEVIRMLLGRPGSGAGCTILDGVLRADMKSTSDYTASFREPFFQGGITSDLALFVAADEMRSELKLNGEASGNGVSADRLLGLAEEISDRDLKHSAPESLSEDIRRALCFTAA